MLLVVVVAGCSASPPQQQPPPVTPISTPGTCTSAAECGTDTDCATWSCDDGACQLSYVPAGTMLTGSADLYCQDDSCDGHGNVVATPDDNDEPPDAGSGACYTASCVNGDFVWNYFPTGTPCGPNNAVCNGGACYTPGIELIVNGPLEVRLLDASNNELIRCTQSCTIPEPAGQYFIEAASPWGTVELNPCPSSMTTSCEVDLTATNYIQTVTASVYPRGESWDFLGDAGEVFRAAAFDTGGNLIIGSNQHVIAFDHQGTFRWSLDMPADSLAAADYQSLYVLSGAQLSKLDVDGDVLWQRTADACPAAEFARCLAIAPNGDVVFGGPSVMRWSGDGTLLWSVLHDPRWQFSSVGVDADGTTFVLQNEGNGVLTAARIADDGTRLADFVDAQFPSLGDDNPQIAVEGAVEVASTKNGVATVRQLASDGSTTHTWAAMTPGTLGMVYGMGQTAIIYNQVSPGLQLGFNQYQLGPDFTDTPEVLGDAPALGIAGELGDVIHGLALSPVGGQVAIVGEYHGLGGETHGWLVVSLPSY